MKQQDLEGSFHKNHTAEVTIDGVKQRVSFLYLDALKKKLGKRINVTKKEEDRAKAYIDADAKVKAEKEKADKALRDNAAKARTKKGAKKDDLS